MQYKTFGTMQIMERFFKLKNAFFNKNHITESINNLKDDDFSRLNIGISGRGDQLLSESQKEKIIAYASFYHG